MTRHVPCQKFSQNKPRPLLIIQKDSYVSEVASYRLNDQGLILDSGMVSLFATTVKRLEMQSTFHLVLRIFFPCTEMTKV